MEMEREVGEESVGSVKERNLEFNSFRAAMNCKTLK